MSDISDAARARLAAWQAARPVVALIGEFSAGKSTLLNALVGTDLLPTRATATRMPAVWLTSGAERVVQGLTYDGDLVHLDDAALAHGTLDAYLALRIADPAPALATCDLVDTPGISDIRLKAGVIATLADHVDLVVWCSNAAQFWRQSEKAMWRTLPRGLRARSILAVTGADRMMARDLDRVLKRGRKETKGLFAAILPIAALDAVAASGDRTAPGWSETGAAALTETLDQAIASLDRTFDPTQAEAEATIPTEKIEAAERNVPGNSANPDIPLFTELQKTIETISEIADEFSLSAFLEQFIATVPEDKVASNARTDVALQLLRQDDANGPDAERCLRQIHEELSDFAENEWCQLN